MTRTILTLLAFLWLPGQDPLPLRHRPQGNVVPLNIGPLGAIAIDSQFSYVGGHRFILGASADAEQHVFAATDASGALRSFYWIQVEELLPERPGAYNYAADSVLTHQGFALRRNTLTYTAPPAPASDRARAFALLEQRGYSIASGARRVRLVYLPEANARREVMIIYGIVPNAGAAADVAAQALGGLTLIPTR